MPKPAEAVILPKNVHPLVGAASERTPEAAWLTVLLGGSLLAGNILELGGVPSAAKEWSAWLIAALVLAHGVCVGWGLNGGTSGLRIPKWVLSALPLLALLGYAWFRDEQAPWLSRDTFFLAVEAWLLCWVVAATPGGRNLSWAWILTVGIAAILPLIAAIGWQFLGKDSWLPMGRTLPGVWHGRLTGTLPMPAAFGALMILAGTPLFVMSCSARLPAFWRILCGVLGAMLLVGALGSLSMGAWLGVAFVFSTLPIVVGGSRPVRFLGYGMGALLLAVLAWNTLYDAGDPAGGLLTRLQSGEPKFADTFVVIEQTWRHNLALGGEGAAFSTLMPGWRYGFSDWTEWAAVWGFAGLAIAGFAFGAAILSGWIGWAKLPFVVSSENQAATNSGLIPSQDRLISFTPETKVLLGATLTSLSAFVIMMLASRTLNVPAVVFALAIIAGVLARNVPQRGGVVRAEPAVRRALSLGLAAGVSILLVGLVAPVARARNIQQKTSQQFEAAAQQMLYRDNPKLLAEYIADFHDVLAADPANAPAWVQLAWASLEQSRFDPLQFDRLSAMAEDAARRASTLAPKAPEPRLAHAMACLRNNRVSAAQCHIREALALAPADPQVRYYAVAVFAVDPKTRETAQRMLEAAREEARAATGHGEKLTEKQLKSLQAAFETCATSAVPLKDLRERPLPRLFARSPLWPPLEGCTAAAPAAAPPARK